MENLPILQFQEYIYIQKYSLIFNSNQSLLYFIKFDEYYRMHANIYLQII